MLRKDDAEFVYRDTGRRRGATVGRRSTVVAWSMLAVFAVCVVVALPLAVANGTFQQDAGSQTLLFLGFSAFMIVGALVVAHRPGNAIGWLFRPAPCSRSPPSWLANTPSMPMSPGPGPCLAGPWPSGMAPGRGFWSLP